MLEFNKIAASSMLTRHLVLALPMDKGLNNERNFLAGGANMPVPYHLDDSDSDSIVSSKFSSDILFSLTVKFALHRYIEQRHDFNSSCSLYQPVSCHVIT